MFEVVLSAVGLGFAAWALLGPAATEHIRVKIAEQAGRLVTMGIVSEKGCGLILNQRV